ncbi:hypothetical protein HMPREF0281_02262 [Corynebacterium ammoniagenes DSM 20306]|uniref:Uncharacterized protein n=1 Tax=Corynebacterium ammoniagenes DSM 20306 TaxID=649754 RepID=A0ABN0ABV3_CORAM|nr:hypothetical protein HMPREF0281_02262 [Corynebacterium ammoniagenes DSM 20306]
MHCFINLIVSCTKLTLSYAFWIVSAVKIVTARSQGYTQVEVGFCLRWC